jgi:hypothetical protein
MSVRAAFRRWWMVKGPTHFKTNADAVRYREELGALAERMAA